MTTEVANLQAGAITQAQADRGRERLKHLLPSLRECPEARSEVERILPHLTRPARGEWVLARVVSLLNPYFEREAPQAIREMEAEDWAEALAEFPEWAINAAVRWWKGADNPRRSRRPVEGDIAERCRIEMGAALAAKRLLTLPMRQVKGDNFERVSPDRAREILDQAGVRVRTFGHG